MFQALNNLRLTRKLLVAFVPVGLVTATLGTAAVI
jgi:hypothetical protein